MATVLSIQRGTSAITSGNTSVTATISTIATANSVVHITVTAAQNQPGGGCVTVSITDSTTITFTRGAATLNSTTITWDVLEYDSSVVVQEVSGTIATPSYRDVTITSVDTSCTFAQIKLYDSNTSGMNQDHAVASSITSSTNIRLRCQGYPDLMHGYVIEYGGATVQAISKSISATSQTDTITSVVRNNTFLIGGFTIGTTLRCEDFPNHILTDSTTITYTKYDNSTTGTAYTYVVETNDQTFIHHSTATTSGTTTTFNKKMPALGKNNYTQIGPNMLGYTNVITTTNQMYRYMAFMFSQTYNNSFKGVRDISHSSVATIPIQAMIFDQQPKPVFYSVSPFGTGDFKSGSPNISISNGIATLSGAQNINIGAGVCIEYNSLKGYIAPNRIPFTNGAFLFHMYDGISGANSGATAVVRYVEVTSGSLGGGDAVGFIYLMHVNGNFIIGENINITAPSANVYPSACTVSGLIQGNIGNGNTQFVLKTILGVDSSTQTSTSVTSIHHEYASLYDFESGFTDANHINNTNLCSANKVAFACCYYDHNDYTADTTAIDFNGTTTCYQRPIVVFCPKGGCESVNRQGHSGVLDTNKYLIACTSDSNSLSIQDDYITVEGLQIKQSTGSTTKSCLYLASCTGSLIIGNLIYDTNASKYYGVQVDTSGIQPNYFINNIVYDCSRGFSISADTKSDGLSDVLINNTVCDCSDIGYYMASGPNGYFINNCSFNNVDDFNVLIDTANSTDNAYSDSVSIGTSPVNISGVAGTTLFNNYSSNDFTLKAGSNLVNQGTNSQASSYYAFWFDNNYRARPTFDVGFNDLHATITSTSSIALLKPIMFSTGIDSGQPGTPIGPFLSNLRLPVMLSNGKAYTIIKGLYLSNLLNPISNSRGISKHVGRSNITLQLPTLSSFGKRFFIHKGQFNSELQNILLSSQGYRVRSINGQSFLNLPILDMFSQGYRVHIVRGNSFIELPHLIVSSGGKSFSILTGSATGIIPLIRSFYSGRKIFKGTWDYSDVVYAILPTALQNGTNPSDFKTGYFPVFQGPQAPSNILFTFDQTWPASTGYSSGKIIPSGSSGHLFSDDYDLRITLGQEYTMVMRCVTPNYPGGYTGSNYLFTIYDPNTIAGFTRYTANRFSNSSNGFFNSLYAGNTTALRAIANTTNLRATQSFPSEQNVAVVFESNGVLKNYYTENEMSYNSSHVSFTDSSDTSTSNYHKIGTYFNNTASMAVTQSIFYFILYNRALSQSELSDLYDLGRDLGGLKGYDKGDGTMRIGNNFMIPVLIDFSTKGIF